LKIVDLEDIPASFPWKGLYASPKDPQEMKSYYTGIMSTSSIDEIEHTADRALHIRAQDLTRLFGAAASGMLTLMGMVTDKAGVGKRKIRVESIDREGLLVAWLEELLFLIEKDGIGFGKIEFEKIDNRSLVATVEVIPDVFPVREIKAVTYHGLEILECEGGLEVTIVFDV